MSYSPNPNQPWWGQSPAWWGPRPTGGQRVHPSQMRIDNTERARITDALCKHFADGRLDEAEFNDRAGRAAAAKTQADLAPLLADLPPLDVPYLQEVSPVPSRSHPLLWILAAVLLAPFLIGGAAIVVGGVTGIAAGVLHALFPFAILIAVLWLVSRRRSRRHYYHHHDERMY